MAPNDVRPSVPPDGGAKIEPGLSEDVTCAGSSGGAGVVVGTVVTSGAGVEMGSAGGLPTGVTSTGGVTIGVDVVVTSGAGVEDTGGLSVGVTVVWVLVGWEGVAPSLADVVVGLLKFGGSRLGSAGGSLSSETAGGGNSVDEEESGC